MINNHLSHLISHLTFFTKFEQRTIYISSTFVQIQNVMKKILLGLFVFPLGLLAQNKQGEIIYKEISKFEVPEEYKQYMRDMPDSIVKETILLFTENESIYKNHENLDAPAESESQSWMMMWFKNDNQVYKNYQEKYTIEKQDFMQKPFLIKGDMVDTVKWKIVPNMQEILGYQCMKATTTKDSTEITVWFTTQIPVSNGPSMSMGLPGMVLKVEVPFGGGKRGSGNMTIVADKITLREVETKEITMPKKGKEVTREEYNEIVKQKIEEMRQNGGGWGGGGH